MAPTNKPRCAQYSITQGPDQMGLAAAQYHITPDGDRIEIEFTLTDYGIDPPGARRGRIDDHALGLGKVIKVKIDGAIREDGSGRNWLIRCSAMLKDGYHHITCFFSTGRRSGTIAIWDKDVVPPTTFALNDVAAVAQLVHPNELKRIG